MDERIRELFAALMQVAPAEVSDETTPAKLERWDSLNHMITVSAFEEEFGLDLDPEEAVEMYESFAAFRRTILRKVESRT
jgi:acyl carrier protein